MKAITLKQQIYQILKKRILEGEYALGGKLNIDIIRKEFSVSLAPVREALTLLVKDNLVVMNPNTGVRVIDFDPQAYYELTDAVNGLLLGAYEICCRRNKKQILLEHLSLRLEKFLESVASGTDREKFYAILLFDRCFVTATENNMYIDIFDNRLDYLYLAYRYNHQNRSIDWEQAIRRNKILLEAVQADKIDIVRDILYERISPHIADEKNGRIP